MRALQLPLKESERFACGLFVFVDACAHPPQRPRLPASAFDHARHHLGAYKIFAHQRCILYAKNKILRHALQLQEAAFRRYTPSIKPAQVLAEVAQQANHRRGATEL